MTEPVSPTAKLGMTLAPWDGAADIRTINSDLAIIDAAFGSVPGDMTIGQNLTVTGVLTVLSNTQLHGNASLDGHLQLTGNDAFPVAGSVYKSPTDGLVVRGAPGSIDDLRVLNNTGQVVFHVPTGSNDVLFADDVTIAGDLTVTGTTSTGAPGDLIARQASVSQSLLGDVAGHAGLLLGNPGDTNLYRQAADILKTDDALQVTLDLTARLGVATQVLVGAVAGNAGLAFGSAGDVNLYRFDANTLKTDDGVVVAGASGLSITGAAGLSVTTGPTVLSGRLSFAASAVGVAGSLYRDAAGGLVLWGVTGSTSDLTLLAASGNSVLAVGAGSQNVTVFNTLLFGAGGDTNLYRSAANVLRTDDALVVGGATLTVTGALAAVGLVAFKSVAAGMAGIRDAADTGYVGLTVATLTATGALTSGAITASGAITGTALSVTPGDATIAGVLTIGSPAAQTGDVRLKHPATIVARNLTNTGDVTMISTDGSSNVVLGSGTMQSLIRGSSVSLLPTGAGVVCDATGVYPGDNTIPCGKVGSRWTAVYAVNGTIQTSTREEKEDLQVLDPAEALALARGTRIYAFRYTGSTLAQLGFVAEDTDRRLTLDGRSASGQVTASLAIAALQELARRVEALEAAP